MTTYHAVIRRKRAPFWTVARKRLLALNTLVGAGALAILPGQFNQSVVAQGVKPQQMQRNIDSVLPLAGMEIVAAKPKRLIFRSSDPDQKPFRSLNSYYVGKSRVVKVNWSDIDLGQNVQFMWDRKLATFAVTPATRKSVDKIVARYRRADHNKTTLPRFIREADLAVNEARSGLDYPRLCARFRLDSERCVRLQYLTGRINGRMLVAYGMTELFPAQDGRTNSALLDMMLRRAGEDYLNSIPALGDKYLSMGFYQFTSFAVRHDADGREGANVVSQFAQRGIPGSVMDLSGAAQHRAAFYFATYNLANMVRNLNARQHAALKAHSPLDRDDLTTFMATAHHLPRGAQSAMQAWLQEGCRNPLREYLRGDLRLYGKKSATNYQALVGKSA